MNGLYGHRLDKIQADMMESIFEELEKVRTGEIDKDEATTNILVLVEYLERTLGFVDENEPKLFSII